MNKSVPDSKSPESAGKVRAELAETKRSLKATGRNIAEKFRGSSRSFAESRVVSAVQNLGEAGLAMRETATRLRSQGQSVVATPIERLADTVDGVVDYLENTSLDEMVSKCADTLRRHPVATMGVALAAGILAGRFFGSSTPNE